jgi:gliding motility-associated-like protein
MKILSINSSNFGGNTLAKQGFLSLFMFFILCRSLAQTNISGVINTYASVSSIALQSVIVSSSTGFTIGDRVLLIQMKGAAIDQLNTPAYGSIININDCGNYELATISSVSLNSISFISPLLKTYSATGLVQLIKVPVYANATVTASLSCPAWNGSVGGVLALECTGTLNMLANIDVSGKGFRGGGFSFGTVTGCNGDTANYVEPSIYTGSGIKGEGVFNTSSVNEKGRAANGNGGGAGTNINGGGAGGANYANGGYGGNIMSSASCPPAMPLNCGGIYGRALSYSNALNKIFLGGGGGSGHMNDNDGTAGTNGGGIIIIRASMITNNNYNIISDGLDNNIIAGIDGQGGGGAGGTILIDACSTSSLGIFAKGGKGGTDNYGGPDCHGKGGGGSGGVIWSANALNGATVNVNGGQPGIFTLSGSWYFNTPGGATAGQPGGALTGLIIPGAVPLISTNGFSISISSNCNGNTATAIATVSLSAISPIMSYSWTNFAGTVLSQTNNSTSLINSVPNLANGIYTLIAQINAPCGPINSQTININCAPPPLCSGTLGARVFMEDFGSGSALYGPALAPGVTNYIYQQGVPNNGTYVISSSSDPSGSPAGYVIDDDHTGNTNGYMMVINSDYPASEVYRKHVTGLCPNTTYVFSSWLSNNNTPSTPTTVCPGYVYANVKFQIEYPVSVIQNSVATGNLPLGLSNTNLNWIEYGFVFTTLPGQSSVDIVLQNNAPGGCGNDYVVDDISLSPCGPGVSLNIVPNQTVFCTGDMVTLQSNYTSGSYISAQYQWQFSNNGGITWNDITGGNSSNYIINSVDSLEAGMYQLLVSENGNISLASCRIVLGPLTFSVSNNVVATPSFTLCAGSSATLTATGTTNYNWNTGSLSNSITVSPIITTSYTVIGTVGTCTSQAATTVSVIPISTVAVTGNTLLCAGQTTTLTASGAGNFTWNSGLTTATISVSPAITTSYSVSVPSGLCSNAGVITVSVVPNPTLTLSPDTSICYGAGASTALSVSGANSYTWNNASTLSAPTGSLVIAFPNITTDYTVTGANGLCTNTAIVTVSVNPSPTITTTSIINTSCGLANGSATVNSSPAINTYTWIPPVPSTTNTADFLDAGNYTVSVSNGPCSTSTVISVSASIPLSITSNTVVASNCNATNGSIAVTDNFPGTSYSWTPGVSSSSMIDSLATGNYSLTLTNGACQTSTVFAVGLLSGPTGMNLIIKNVLCELDSGSVKIDSILNGVSPYSYSFNNSGFSSILTYTNLSQGVYVVAVKDRFGCAYTQTVAVQKDNILSKIDLRTKIPGCEIQDGEFYIKNITGGQSPYLLSFNHGAYTSDIIFDMLGPGTYTLNILDSNKCETELVLIMPETVEDYILYIPNTFTPNKDERNDVWFVKGACLNSFNCLIYNRWGEKLAELKNLNESWDGIYRGLPVPDGVYVYLIEAETQNGTINKAGHITVLR